jgi:hypothetical protein
MTTATQNTELFYGPGVYLLSIAQSFVDQGWNIMAAKCDSLDLANKEMILSKDFDQRFGTVCEYEIVEVETLKELEAHAARIRDEKK